MCHYYLEFRQTGCLQVKEQIKGTCGGKIRHLVRTIFVPSLWRKGSHRSNGNMAAMAHVLNCHGGKLRPSVQVHTRGLSHNKTIIVIRHDPMLTCNFITPQAYLAAAAPSHPPQQPRYYVVQSFIQVNTVVFPRGRPLFKTKLVIELKKYGRIPKYICGNT